MARVDITRDGEPYGFAVIEGDQAAVTIWTTDDDGVESSQTFNLSAGELVDRIAAIPGAALVEVEEAGS